MFHVNRKLDSFSSISIELRVVFITIFHFRLEWPLFIAGRL